MTPHDRAYIRRLINRLPTVHIKETSKHHVHMREVDGDHNLIADVYCSTDRAHAAEISALWSEAPNVIRDLLVLVDKLEDKIAALQGKFRDVDDVPIQAGVKVDHIYDAFDAATVVAVTPDGVFVETDEGVRHFEPQECRVVGFDSKEV